jgi:hypothetical protein
VLVAIPRPVGYTLVSWAFLLDVIDGTRVCECYKTEDFTLTHTYLRLTPIFTRKREKSDGIFGGLLIPGTSISVWR